MTTYQFKPGDKVKCFGYGHAPLEPLGFYQGDYGEVIKIYSDTVGVKMYASLGSLIRGFHPHQLELVEAAKQKKKVKLVAYFNGREIKKYAEHGLFIPVFSIEDWKRVPSEDKIVEIEE